MIAAQSVIISACMTTIVTRQPEVLYGDSSKAVLSPLCAIMLAH